MTNEDIFIACVKAKSGDAVSRQFQEWIDGSAADNDLSSGAMQEAWDVIRAIAEGGNALSEEARTVLENLAADGFTRSPARTR